ncbi:MAG: beta-ketoacyl-[acyl-carrier-protein] synthase family protein [Pirellulales bacterium]
MAGRDDQREPIVITGIGLIASVGSDRESVWRAVRQGQSGVRSLEGLLGIPDGLMIGAPVAIEDVGPLRLKAITLCQKAAEEALADGRVDLAKENLDRFGCAISGHMGDTSFVPISLGMGHLIDPRAVPWWEQWMPNTACSTVANRYGLTGPRICHSTACASGLIDILCAARSLRDSQCDIALAGSAEGFHPLFAAGFRQMKVLADDENPTQACRPFDAQRHGFVMGEGAAMFILEKHRHAVERGARIYAELAGGKMLAQAHDVAGLDSESDALAYLITATLRDARLAPEEIDYISAHGTGTLQNDLTETRGIRRSMGKAADELCVSSIKSMLGHLVNASGSVELAITTLALRDGFVPPTINLTHPDPECDLDFIPLVGRHGRFDNALKLSVAFGGHLVAAALRRWNDPETGFPRPAAA